MFFLRHSASKGLTKPSGLLASKTRRIMFNSKGSCISQMHCRFSTVMQTSLKPTIHQLYTKRIENSQSFNANDVVTVYGWVRTVRAQKNVVFISLNDGSNPAGLQIVVESNAVCSEETVNLAKSITIGSSLQITGHLVRNQRYDEMSAKAYEVSAHSILILGTCLQSTETNQPSEIELKRAAKKAAKEASRLASRKAKLVENTQTDPTLDSLTVNVNLINEEDIKKCTDIGPGNDNLLTPYPLQKKKATLAYLREYPHIRPRTNTYSSILRLRSSSSHLFHEFFRGEDYLQLHTPVITPSDCEGAGEMFRVTTDIPAFQDKSVLPSTREFFNTSAYLSVSGQLYAEIGSASLPRVYSFGPTFRAENSNTTRHLAEFWMLEPEIAFATKRTVMEQCEKSIKYVIEKLLVERRDDLEILQDLYEDDLIEKLQKVVLSSFQQISYTEALRVLNEAQDKGEIQFTYPLTWGSSLQSEHEKYLAEQIYQQPVFITDYPASFKPFYMFMNPTKEEFEKELETIVRPNLDGTATLTQVYHGIDVSEIVLSTDIDRRTVACFDLIVPGVGELCGGSQREHRYDVLLENMKHHNMDLKSYQWYLDLRRFGTVPHGGWGMGFERFLAYVGGLENVRDTTLVPRAPHLMQM